MTMDTKGLLLRFAVIACEAVVEASVHFHEGLVCFTKGVNVFARWGTMGRQVAKEAITQATLEQGP